MDALILSCGTGGGHDAAGRAIKEALLRAGHHVTMFNPYCLKSEKVARRIDRTYISMVQHTRCGFRVLYRLGDVVRRIPGRSPVYFANRGMISILADYLAEHPVDVVFMPHLFPAEILTGMKRRGLPAPKFVFVATDYTCIPFTEETMCDAYVVPTAELIPEFVRWGIPREKIYPFGIPVSATFSAPCDRATLSAELSLDPDRRYVLISGGSMGAGKVDKVIDHVLTLNADESRPLTPIVVCGNNDALHTRLAERHGTAIELLHTTDRMADYLRIAELYMTKPGGLSTTEAAVLGVPLVHLPPISGCETRNARYFAERGMSRRLSADTKDMRRALDLLKDPDAMRAMVTAQRDGIPRDAADRIAATFCTETFLCTP